MLWRAQDAARKRYNAQTAEDNRHMQVQAAFERQRRNEEEVAQARRMVQEEVRTAARGSGVRSFVPWGGLW